MKKINCRCCGKITNKKKKCFDRKSCCDCTNGGYGCYSDPLFRRKIGCPLDSVLPRTLEELESKQHMVEAWGYSIDKIKEEWQDVNTINPFKKGLKYE